MSTSSSPAKIAELARRCFDTYLTADRAALERMLSDDFRFTSPYDDHIDRATYFERCWPNAGTFDVFELQHVVVQGERAWVTYTGHSKTGRWFHNTEVLRCVGDHIVEVEVFFGLPPHSPPQKPPADPRSESSRG